VIPPWEGPSPWPGRRLPDSRATSLKNQFTGAGARTSEGVPFGFFVCCRRIISAIRARRGFVPGSSFTGVHDPNGRGTRPGCWRRLRRQWQCSEASIRVEGGGLRAALRPAHKGGHPLNFLASRHVCTADIKLPPSLEFSAGEGEKGTTGKTVPWEKAGSGKKPRPGVRRGTDYVKGGADAISKRDLKPVFKRRPVQGRGDRRCR